MNRRLRELSLLTLLFSALALVSASALAESGYTFSIVPQQSAIKTARTWGPVISFLNQQTGYHFHLRTEKDIPTFGEQLNEGVYDFAYMNPYHYTVAYETQGYDAFAKAWDTHIQGILVVNKDSGIESLEQLQGREIAFPSPDAFGASILPRAYLEQQAIKIEPSYVSSHDSVYLNVALGHFAAGGGVIRTLENFQQAQRGKLKILWRSQEYTPHAIAAHPRIPTGVVNAVQQALLSLAQTPSGREILEALKIKGFEKAENSDWDDVRGLNTGELD